MYSTRRSRCQGERRRQTRLSKNVTLEDNRVSLRGGVREMGTREFDRECRGRNPFPRKKKKRKKNALKLALSSLTFRVASDAASKIHATRILMQRGAISTRGNL